MRPPPFDFKRFRETKTLQHANPIPAKTLIDRTAIDAFMEKINKRHEPEQSDPEIPATAVADEFLRSPAAASAEASATHDPDFYIQQLGTILDKCRPQIVKLNIEMHKERIDREANLTRVGKWIVQGLRWWRSIKSPLEEQLEAFQKLAKDLETLINILTNLAPLTISIPLQQQCEECERKFSSIKCGIQRLIDDGD